MSIEKLRIEIMKNKLKSAMFLSIYWVWCFSFFVFNAVMVASGGGLHYAANGIIQVSCLFLAAMMIEDLLNEH